MLITRFLYYKERERSKSDRLKLFIISFSCIFRVSGVVWWMIEWFVGWTKLFWESFWPFIKKFSMKWSEELCFLEILSNFNLFLDPPNPFLSIKHFNFPQKSPYRFPPRKISQPENLIINIIKIKNLYNINKASKSHRNAINFNKIRKNKILIFCFYFITQHILRCLKPFFHNMLINLTCFSFTLLKKYI